jgi:hypothetical protein
MLLPDTEMSAIEGAGFMGGTGAGVRRVALMAPTSQGTCEDKSYV